MYYTTQRPPGLKNLGLPWAPEEVARLEQLLKEGLPTARIAEIMERSTVAVRSKAASRGWRLRSRGRPLPPRNQPPLEG